MNRNKHRVITSQVWTAVQGIMLLSALYLWLFVLPTPSIAVFLLVLMERLWVQFKGFFENGIEDLLNWPHDFDNWE